MRMILTMSNFVFNDRHFIQQHGTAMGTRMALAFANPFMGERGKFLTKLWCCVGGKYNKIIWFHQSFRRLR